ncbi:MAG TPA: PA2169 family four-helix-bundle protein [Terracidiphilus sp.]|nr:PA2169 family four-helix-bundle protein [Terracidiphilus sp.]
MPNPSENIKDAEPALRTVIDVLLDCQAGLRTIGDRLKDESLRRFFLAESLKRARFRGDIQSLLHGHGVHDILQTAHFGVTVPHAWADFKSMSNDGDHSLLETAEEGENAAQKAYSNLLKQYLPLALRQLLSKQAEHIQMSHDHIRTACNACP